MLENMSVRNEKVRSILKYAGALGVAGSVSLLLSPVLSRNMTTEAFGQLSAAILYVNTLSVFCTFSIHGLVSVKYHKLDRTSFVSLFSVALTMFFVAWAVFNLIFQALVYFEIINLPWKLSVFAPVISFLLGLNLIYLSLFQTAEQVDQYCTSKVANASLDIFITICVLYLFVSLIELSRFLGWTFGLALALGYSILLAKLEIKPRLSRASVSTVLSFCGPLFPHVAVGLLSGLVDKILVYEVLGPTIMAPYMLATYLGAALLIIIEPLNKAFAPWIFKELKKKNINKLEKYTKIYYLVLGLASFCFYFFGVFFVTLLMPEEYIDALEYLPFILAGVFFQGLYLIKANVLFYFERNFTVSKISIFVFCANIFLALFLVDNFGASGAAATGVIVNGLAFTMVRVFANKIIGNINDPALHRI